MSETYKLAEELAEKVRQDDAAFQRLQEHSNSCAKVIHACQRELQKAGADDKMDLKSQIDWLINLTFLKKASSKALYYSCRREGAESWDVVKRHDSIQTVVMFGLGHKTAERVVAILNEESP